MDQIVLSGIKKSFGQTQVLAGIDLAIDRGEFLTLVGPSGCGKSTLLRIIAGLEAQNAGSVRIGERVVNDVRASERDLAMVFQSYALYPHLTVEENMLTPLRLRDLSFAQRLPLIGRFLPGAVEVRKKMAARVAETSAILKIEPLLKRKPGQLSGGQRQRAALGRAMVREPVAFLMDEPLSNLDAALRVHMRAELADLHRRLATTFIYVTHDQSEALTMSTRMAVMMDGEILQLDRPQTVYDDPAELRVAEFVGSPKINTLPGESDREGRVTCLGLPLQRRVERAAEAKHPGPVTIGLRPEHLRVLAGPEAGALSGRVTHRENLGSDIYLHLALVDGATRLVVRAAPHEAAELSIGATVYVGRARGEALAFAGDGRRVRLARAEGHVGSGTGAGLPASRDEVAVA